MKPQIYYFIALELLCGALASAQVPPPQNVPAAPEAEAGASQAMGAHLTPEQLDQLLGPIALYPDALIALILPAATEPSDVVLAARYLNGGDPAQVDEQPWDDSVRALAHYPDLVKWMDENLAWTRQLGAAFLDQPAEIMKSVQRLRAEARAAGTLVDTPQQQVVAEGENIMIVPAQPDVIYVPYYDPEIVYVHRDYYPGPYLSFSVGFPVGFWLGYNVDWGHRRIWVVDRRERERFWHDQRDWRRPVFTGPTVAEHSAIEHTWRPNPSVVRPTRPAFNQAHPQIVHPAPISRAAQRPPQPRENAASTSTAVRRDGVPETHDTSRQPSEIRHAMPTRPENHPPAPVAGQVQAPAQVPAPTPAPVISRGGRGAQPEDNTPREHRERTAPVVTPNNAQTPGRAIPVPQQPNVPNPPAIPLAPIRTERVQQAAPTTTPAPQPKPQPPAQEEGRRRRESDNEKDK